MTAIDAVIEIYLTGCEVEGKSPRTLYSYAETLRAFGRAGAELGLPDELEAYGVQEAYAYLGHVRARAAKLRVRLRAKIVKLVPSLADVEFRARQSGQNTITQLRRRRDQHPPRRGRRRVVADDTPPRRRA